MKQVIIIGAGGFGREVEMLISQINTRQLTWDLLGFLDESLEAGTAIGSTKVIGGIDSAKDYSEAYFVLALGNPKSKRNVAQRLGPKAKFATLIHPNVLIGDRVSIGDGSIICAGCLITVDISLGKHTLLNLACTVGHDTIIGDYSSFMPGVNISGEVVIKAGVYVGTGAKIINQLEIGEDTIVGSGAVVSKSLPPYCTAVGIPAKPIKFHDES